MDLSYLGSGMDLLNVMQLHQGTYNIQPKVKGSITSRTCVPLAENVTNML